MGERGPLAPCVVSAPAAAEGVEKDHRGRTAPDRSAAVITSRVTGIAQPSHAGHGTRSHTRRSPRPSPGLSDGTRGRALGPPYSWGGFEVGGTRTQGGRRVRDTGPTGETAHPTTDARTPLGRSRTASLVSRSYVPAVRRKDVTRQRYGKDWAALGRPVGAVWRRWPRRSGAKDTKTQAVSGHGSATDLESITVCEFCNLIFRAAVWVTRYGARPNAR